MSRLSRVLADRDMQRILADFQHIQGRCYLDNAGAAMYPRSQMEAINEDLLNNVYMNPHTDKFSEDCIDQIRYNILNHFNADRSAYTVIFTSGSTQAFKLIVESFQFNKNSYLKKEKEGAFVYLLDNHTSVLGMREVAKQKNADIIRIGHHEFLQSSSETNGVSPDDDLKMADENALFVYAAQNNFNGFKYPLSWVNGRKCRELNKHTHKSVGKKYKNWYVFLDSACYVSTNKLNLSVHQPDFLCVSFYKIFGFPTGLGAVLVKNSSAGVLNQKTYFGGGTVDVLVSDEDYHVKRKVLHERFEDGTVSFLSIISLKHCFDTLNRLIPKVIDDDLMETISHHTFYLAKDLYEQLNNLQHVNGQKAVHLYGDSDYTDVQKQGAIVSFNLMRPDGQYIGYSEVQHMANLFNINLRVGCFCNAGTCQRHLKLSSIDIKAMFAAGHVCGDWCDLYLGKPTGCMRVSFGYYNSFRDVDELMTMICKCFVQTTIVKPDRSLIACNGFHDKNGIDNGIDNINRMNDRNTDLLDANTDTKNENQKNGFVIEKTNNEMERGENNFMKPRYTNQAKKSPVLDEIAIFPIKSCGAYKINSSWKIGSKGFEFDREWMIIRDNGVCLTQKHCPHMCMIRPSLNLAKRLLVISFPGKPDITVPLDMKAITNGVKASFCQSKVCNDSIEGYDCGEEVGDWISEALEISFLRLIKQCHDSERTLKKSISQDNIMEKTMLSLSNQAQFLLVNKATVRWLATKIEDANFDEDIIGLVDRFRANIIVDTETELVEKEWTKVIIGKHQFKVEGPCTRCQMVCIDQQTGCKTVEPLRTISKEFSGKLRFGIYLSYMGTIDGCKDRTLECCLPVEATHGTADRNNSECLKSTNNFVNNTKNRHLVFHSSFIIKKKSAEHINGNGIDAEFHKRPSNNDETNKANFLRQNGFTKRDVIIKCEDQTNGKNSEINGHKSLEDVSVLEEMAIFPIKSCGAFKINTNWSISSKGFEFDREWMIIRDNGVCLTQKQCTRMCLIRPSFNFAKRLLVLNFPGKPPITVPLDMKPITNGVKASFCQSKVCNDSIEGYDCGEEVGDWISEALEISFLRLIKQCHDSERILKKLRSQDNIMEKTMLSLSNQAQFLLINKATVQWLASKIEDPHLDKDITGLTDRFRGNIIVDTNVELVEREWTKVVIGKHKFKVEGPCNRCQMVCIDQKSGEKTVEPLRTISKEFAGKMRFGIYLSYLGTVDGSRDRMLQCHLPVKATSGSAEIIS